MNHRMRSVTCVTLLATQFLAGCTSWQFVGVSPRALVDSAHVTKMQVTERGGAKYVFQAPRVVDDSLTGSMTTGGEFATSASAKRRISLAAIDRVAISRLNVGATIGGISAIVALVVVVYVVNYCSPKDSCDFQ